MVLPIAPPNRFEEGCLHPLGWLRVKMVTSNLDPDCVMFVFFDVFWCFLLFCLRLCRAAKGMFIIEEMHKQDFT